MKLREMNDWKISNDTLKLGVELGRGSFGIVMAAEWRHTPVALKILFADAQADDKVLFEKEVRMMATLHHPNIVQFLGYARTPALTLVIELFPEGSVERFVPREKPGQKTSLRFCIDMALAIEYLHSRQPSIVIHRCWLSVCFPHRWRCHDAASPRRRRRGRMRVYARGNFATLSVDAGT